MAGSRNSVGREGIEPPQPRAADLQIDARLGYPVFEKSGESDDLDSQGRRNDPPLKQVRRNVCSLYTHQLDVIETSRR